MATAHSATLPVLVVVLLALVLLAAPPRAAGALTCGQVLSFSSPCIPYLQGKGPLTDACCSGVRNVIAETQTTPDRQALCKCFKMLLTSINGIDVGILAGAPGKCHVNAPFPLSASVDCATVK